MVSCFLKEIILINIKDESQLRLITGPCKTNPTKKLVESIQPRE